MKIKHLSIYRFLIWPLEGTQARRNQRIKIRKISKEICTKVLR